MSSGIWILFISYFLELNIHLQERVCQMQIFDLNLGFSKIFCVCYTTDYLWDGLGTWGGGGKLQEGGDICVYMADSYYYMTEANTVL